MPAKDKYHDIVRNALDKSGWEITHDPYFLRLGRRKGFIDLGWVPKSSLPKKALRKLLLKSKVSPAHLISTNLRMLWGSF